MAKFISGQNLVETRWNSYPWECLLTLVQSHRLSNVGHLLPPPLPHRAPTCVCPGLALPAWSCVAPRFGRSSAEDGGLCWEGIPANGKSMGVFTGLREGDGKMLWMVGPSRVSWHVVCHCKKTRNLVNVPSLRPPLGSYIDVFSGGKKNLQPCII